MTTRMPTSTPEWALRLRALPLALRLALLVPALVMPGFWWGTYSGPFRWLAELQLRILGSYSPVLTAAILFAVCVGAVFGILVLLARKVAFTEEQVRGEHERSARQNAWVQQHGIELGGAITMVIFGGLGLFSLTHARLIGPLTDLDVAALESGTAPPSHYVQLSAKLRKWDGLVVTEEGSGYRTPTYYYPLASIPGSDEVRAAVVLEITEPQLDEHGESLSGGVYVGTLHRIPGFIRSELAHQGVALADRAWVLDYLDGPGKDQELGLLYLALAGTAVLVMIIARGLRHRRVGARGAGVS